MTTKKDVYKVLDISSIEAPIDYSQWKETKSEWSKRIILTQNDVEAVGSTLYNIFKPSISKENWDHFFHMSIGGNGNELTKITTIHSSSLLALLFFSAVSELNPIRIDNHNYNNVYFEIKNKVFPNASITDMPSNIDVLLVSDDKESLLFLESKFTEYIDHGKIAISDKYKNFYQNFFNNNNDTGLRLIENTIECISGNNSKYISGIKQMFSHIIGLATKPHESVKDDIKMLINNAKNIIIKEIVFKFEETEFNNYSNLYKNVFKSLDSKKLEVCLKDYGCDRKKISRISIGEELLTYQTLLKDNSEYQLSPKIKKFYSFNEYSPSL